MQSRACMMYLSVSLPCVQIRVCRGECLLYQNRGMFHGHMGQAPGIHNKQCLVTLEGTGYCMLVLYSVVVKRTYTNAPPPGPWCSNYRTNAIQYTENNNIRACKLLLSSCLRRCGPTSILQTVACKVVMMLSTPFKGDLATNRTACKCHR